MSTMFKEKIVIFFDGGDKRAAADAGLGSLRTWLVVRLVGKKCIRGGRHGCMTLRT